MVDHFQRERNYERIRYIASPRNQSHHRVVVIGSNEFGFVRVLYH